MTARGSRRSHASDAVLGSLVYLLTLTGLFFYVQNAFDSSSGLPNLRTGFIGALILILPATLLIVLAILISRLVADLRARTWGSPTRLRTLALFALVGILSSVPPSALLGTLAVRALQAPASVAVKAGLDSGLELALAYYAEKDAQLKYAVEKDVPAIVKANGPDAVAALSALSARDPAISAVEFFSAAGSVGFAGNAALRSPDTSPSERSGFLPRLSVGGASYSRYYLRDAGNQAGFGRLSVAVATRASADVERAATGLSAARKALPDAEANAGSAPGYLLYFILASIAPLLALAAIFSLGASDALVAPLEALAAGVKDVASGARRATYLAKPGDEAGALIESFNAMLDRLERSTGDQMRSERLVAWRDMARRLAHELRNPLTPIRLSAERVLRRWNSDPGSVATIIEPSMVAIIQETGNMESLLAEFRDFARLPEPHKDWLNLKEVISESLHLYSASWPNLTLDAGGVDGSIRLRADRGHLKQVLGNLVANAADATGGNGRVWIGTDLVKTADSRYCRLQVRDDGAGIPAEARGQVFSPYFSTKPGGTGLGLAIVEHIVSAHGGSIRFETAEGHGTVFIIDLPADEE